MVNQSQQLERHRVPQSCEFLSATGWRVNGDEALDAHEKMGALSRRSSMFDTDPSDV